MKLIALLPYISLIAVVVLGFFSMTKKDRWLLSFSRFLANSIAGINGLIAVGGSKYMGGPEGPIAVVNEQAAFFAVLFLS